MEKFYKNINICILYGRIVSDINFNFFYNSRINNSLVEFEIELNYKYSTRKLKNEKVIIKAYDNIADKIYSKYRIEDYIEILGRVTAKGIEVTQIV